MTLYSFNGGYPGPIPFRILLSNGYARTDPSSFTPLEIADAGYHPVNDSPSYNSETQELGWVDGEWVVSSREPNAPVALSLSTVASADLAVVDGEVTGVERAIGLEMAMMIDSDTAWLFFAPAQPDTDYIVTPSDGVTRYEDFIEVVKPNASRIQVLVQRLQ